ncbi:hypothetical protein TCAL_17169 [Tigriopus californicus]|uniref:Uncharacterized protein n=1 Tax=Tigriopus californicus TaxID=6832 RepID=A0A553N7G5_TIGCA|nr:hypothetical protein TCAL_17169 [Tigriopus californicus]
MVVTVRPQEAAGSPARESRRLETDTSSQPSQQLMVSVSSLRDSRAGEPAASCGLTVTTIDVVARLSGGRESQLQWAMARLEVNWQRPKDGCEEAVGQPKTNPG